MEANPARQQEADRLAQRLEFLAGELGAIGEDWPDAAKNERRHHLLTGIEATRLQLKSLARKGIRPRPPGKASAVDG